MSPTNKYSIRSPAGSNFLWIFLGCLVNAHLYQNKLIKAGTVDPKRKQTLVKDTSSLLLQLLDKAKRLDRGRGG